jgi:plastocyanin
MTMQDELETMRANGARAATRPRVGAIIAATTFLAVLVIAAWAMAGPAARVAKRETAAATPAAADKQEVTIKEFAFHPKTLEISAGSTVTWTNADGDTHTVTSSNGAFTSPALDSGETFSQTFTAPGTYNYFCALHPHMTAQVIVK